MTPNQKSDNTNDQRHKLHSLRASASQGEPINFDEVVNGVQI